MTQEKENNSDSITYNKNSFRTMLGFAELKEAWAQVTHHREDKANHFSLAPQLRKNSYRTTLGFAEIKQAWQEFCAIRKNRG